MWMGKVINSKAAPIHIGTSGWVYLHWKQRFYPTDLPIRQWLSFYANYFQSVEINNSFYRLPNRNTLVRWANCVPPSFLFSVKASRYITHMKKLLGTIHSTQVLLRRVSVLENRLGPILFQLPPRWKINTNRLDQFLGALSDDYRYAFEFRDQSWINSEILALLTRHHAAFCVYDFDGYQSPRVITTDFAYVRLHGPDGPYRGYYDQSILADWANTLTAWAAQGHEVFCYFDNDNLANAAHNAAQLCDLIRH